MASSGAIPYHLVLSGRKVRRRFLFWPGRPDIRVSVARTLLPPPAVVTSGEIGGLSTPCTFAENSTVRWTSEVSVLELEATAPRCLGPGSVSLRSVTAEEPEARERAAGARTRPRGPTIVSSAEQVSEPDIQEVSLAQRLAVVLSPPLATCLSGSGPLEWPGELHKFQKEGVAALVNRPVVLLADEMGLGRTIQAAAAMRILARRGEIERVLVVAPAGVLRNWRHELNRWAPELRVLEVSGPQNERRWKWKANVHVKLVSYETLRNDIALARGEGASILPWDLVCLDEAQRIKNWDSEISRAARSLWAPRRWAITGTPLENSLDDVRTILSFLEPSQAGYASAFAAGDREVRERLERLQLRRKKSDVLPDLPPKMETELYVELTPEQREDYQKLLTGGVIELRDKGESVSVADVLALITRLKQVCNFSFRTGSSSKLDDVAGRLRAISEEGHKALIFSQFTSEQYGVRKLADKLSEFRPHIYTGDMSLDDRRRAVDSFQADPESRVLILSLKAGGLGLNLQAASYVFHFDRWWNPATERQAEDRSHRIGQTRGVNVYKYVCSNTIEERIQKILADKRALFAEYIDDVCLDLRDWLTEEELFGLFDLKPPRKKAAPDRVDFGSMSATDFEEYVRQRLVEYGYEVELTPASRDGGIDLVAKKTDELGLEATLLVQCKNWSSPAGPDVIRELNGVLPRDGRPVRGMVACPGGFTEEAIRFADANHIILWGPNELKQRLRTGQV